jgi:hypothetical protein
VEKSVPVFLSLLLVFFLSSLPFSSIYASESRVALIIGNAAYPKAPLKNSVNDARALAGNLRALGFDVTLLENARLEPTKAAIAEFSGKEGRRHRALLLRRARRAVEGAQLPPPDRGKRHVRAGDRHARA